MESIKALIQSDQYNKLLSSIQKETGIEVNETLPPLALLNYDLDRIKKAGTNPENLANLLKLDSDKFLNYSLLHFNKFSAQVNEDGEYPDGEELDDDEKPKTIKVLPYYKDFLVTALVEYYLLKNSPVELLKYLKATRIPNAKQHEKDLKEIYSKL